MAIFMPVFMEFLSKVSAQELRTLFDFNRAFNKYRTTTSKIRENITIVESYATSGITFIYPTMCSTSRKAKTISAHITPIIMIKFFAIVRIRLDAVCAYFVANTGDCKSSLSLDKF
ncbi:MAG TPA: hypothetical protein VFR94_17200 [Nitrososphaeraceae archaeon]|nr:hypothetical protein [Nitrososphaeraceae archaeon]